MSKIKYVIGEHSICETDCPHGIGIILMMVTKDGYKAGVGSYACVDECPFFDGIHYEKHYVICSHPEEKE